LWTKLEEWILIIYPFIEGYTGWNPSMTDVQWQTVGTTFRQIHQFRLPAASFQSMRRETFDPTEYGRSVQAIEAEYISAIGGSQMEQTLRSLWLAHQPTIHTAVASLEKLATVLREQSGPQVICHADLHPGNLIRSQGSEVFVIDWDDVMLAPKERDFLFVGEVRVNGSAWQDPALFFQGYGQTDIDWAALTYYLWERFIQDVIYDAEAVFLRDDVGEANKAASVETIAVVLAGEANFSEKAFAAAAHLPADLRFPDKEIHSQ
jgi:spectinomycin phosphotransferase